MPILTTAGAPPIFLSFPYVNSFADSQGQIVASSMQALVHRIYQMDPTAVWLGSLGPSDAQDEIITMGLYAGSSLIGRTIGAFILLNHNLNNFLVEYCTDYTAGPADGVTPGTGTWATLVNVTGQAGADYYYFPVSPIANVNGLRITMHTTTPANSYKQLGNLIASSVQFQLGNPPSKFKPMLRGTRTDVYLADKTFDSTFFYWSDNSFMLFELDFEFDFLSSADKTSLDSILSSPNSFLLVPEPGDTSRNVYLCMADQRTYVPDYNTQWKSGGRKIPFKALQVGYL